MLILMIILYSEYCYLLPYLIAFVFNWIFFIKSNFFNTKVKTLNTDVIQNTNIIKKTHYSVYIKFINIQFIFIFLCFFFIKGYSSNFFWNHFCINNTTVYIIQTITLFFIIILFTLNSLISNNINYNIDFFFSLINVIIYLNILYFSNNLFTTVFLLELNSITLFYKFVCSKFWYKTNKNQAELKFDSDNRQMPKNYLNMLFFQYWSTFFSSILLFFSLANIFYIYGSSDYILLNIINLYNNSNFFIKIKFITLVWLPFIIGFLMKLGLTPLHLFKIEVYKGLPIISLLFYTTLYFFIYFVYFLLLFNTQLDSIKILLNTIYYIIIIAGILYVLTLIFDVTSMKSFFAYSTIINGLLFFIANYLF